MSAVYVLSSEENTALVLAGKLFYRKGGHGTVAYLSLKGRGKINCGF